MRRGEGRETVITIETDPPLLRTETEKGKERERESADASRTPLFLRLGSTALHPLRVDSCVRAPFALPLLGCSPTPPTFQTFSALPTLSSRRPSCIPIMFHSPTQKRSPNAAPHHSNSSSSSPPLEVIPTGLTSPSSPPRIFASVLVQTKTMTQTRTAICDWKDPKRDQISEVPLRSLPRLQPAACHFILNPGGPLQSLGTPATPLPPPTPSRAPLERRKGGLVLPRRGEGCEPPLTLLPCKTRVFPLLPTTEGAPAPTPIEASRPNNNRMPTPP
mmetsp:Transcript_35343/g.69747  ORF Transcript_35343/g.69747 Transcript_35343/m.69747 type:complete len:275 (+) Transcript_35343:14-838(+)